MKEKAQKEPQTDEEFCSALSRLGYKVTDTGERYFVRKRKGGGITRLDAEEYSSALLEAWNLVKP